MDTAMIGKGYLIAVAAVVPLVLACWRATSSDQAVITLDPEKTYQVMTGWQARVGADWEDYPATANTWTPTVIDQAVNDLGIDRVRIVALSGIENSTDYFQQYLGGQVTRGTWIGKRNEVINDNGDANSINPTGFKWTSLDFQIDNVVVPLKQRLDARGERLWVNVRYQEDSAGSHLYRSDPNEYAEFVLATYQHLQNKYGWVPDSWMIINEPDQNQWRSGGGTLLGNVIRAAGNQLVARGFTPHFILPGTSAAGAVAFYYDNAKAVAGAAQHIKGIDYHRYDNPSDSVLQAIGTRALNDNIQSGMTERVGATYVELHNDLKFGRCSYWEQFTLAYPLSADNGAQYYRVDNSTGEAPKVIIGSRTKFLRQYFKYIRRGAQRIGASADNSDFDPLAFINTDGKYVVVVKANRGGGFSVQGLPAGTYGVRYTTASEYDADAGDQSIAAGQALEASIPDTGVITVFARSTQAPPDGRAILDRCSVSRSSSGSYSLTIVGRNIKEDAAVTVGGSVPKKIKFKDEVSPGVFTRLVVKKKFCQGLPGAIVITNPGAQPSAPLLCSSSCV
jgi:hypothetical protein